VEKHIGKLKKQGRLHRAGPTKGGYWEVVRKENPEKRIIIKTPGKD